MADAPQMEDDEESPDDELQEMSHSDLINQINNQIINNSKK